LNFCLIFVISSMPCLFFFSLRCTKRFRPFGQIFSDNCSYRWRGIRISENALRCLCIQTPELVLGFYDRPRGAPAYAERFRLLIEFAVARLYQRLSDLLQTNSSILLVAWHCLSPRLLIQQMQTPMMPLRFMRFALNNCCNSTTAANSTESVA